MSTNAAEAKEKRVTERYNARLHEFQESNKKYLCYSNLFSILITVGCLAGTLVILNTYPESCSDSWLRVTLWLMIGMHAINAVEGVCGITGLDNVFCGCVCVVGFFAYEVAVLGYMQVILYSSTHCVSETPVQYWWLLANNLVYFVLLILLIALKIRGICGQPSKEEVEEQLRKEQSEAQGVDDKTAN